MTNIEQKALELVNEVAGSGSWTLTSLSHPYNRVVFTALCRAIERHEAFRQEVSDALKGQFIGGIPDKVARFIIAKPDPLVIEAREICARVCEGWTDIPKDRAAAYRAGAHDDEADFAYAYAALAKRGGRIVFDD